MKEKLVDLFIPALLIGVCSFLLINGIDGEVKVILTMAAAWAFHGAITKSPPKKGS